MRVRGHEGPVDPHTTAGVHLVSAPDTREIRDRAAPGQSSSTPPGSPRSTPVADRSSPSSATSCAPRSRPGAATCRAATTSCARSASRSTDVRVLIVGQDPYPTPGPPGRAQLLAWRPTCGRCRGAWSTSTPSCATTSAMPTPTQRRPHAVDRAGRPAAQPGPHRPPGPSPPATRARAGRRSPQQAISALVARGGPLVAILWGRQAQSLAPMLGDVPRVESAHPSPLSAHSGFFGSRPFSRANALLVAAGRRHPSTGG